MSDQEFKSASGIPLKPYYQSADVGSPLTEVPGEADFTRGIFAEGYRRFPWMESLACGYGLPEETNERIRYLASVGQSGYGGRMSINLVFDRPTFCGLDSDHPMAKNEVGNVGVAIDCLDDMEKLFHGFDLTQLNVGFIADRSGPFLMAMYFALADKLEIERKKLRGIVCNNPLTDFYCSKTPMFPPAESLRLMIDCMEFCNREAPRFNTIRINGYNTRELGSSAVQEVGFNLAIAATIITAALDKGLDPNNVVGNISFQFSQGRDFFEDICKIRAARRMWTTLLKEKFGVTDDAACRMKIHMQTAGSSLTAQEPLNNITRIGLQVMSAALAGCQSMHVASFDEALGIPTEKAVRTAIKTSKIVMHETGVVNVADPLGGSYYVEALTDELEKRIHLVINEVEASGGVIKALESGYFEQQIANTAYFTQNEIEDGERIIVGVNAYKEGADVAVNKIFRPDPEKSKTALSRIVDLKNNRDGAAAWENIGAIKMAAGNGNPMMPVYVKAAKAGVTLGEMVSAVEEAVGKFNFAAITANVR